MSLRPPHHLRVRYVHASTKKPRASYVLTDEQKKLVADNLSFVYFVLNRHFAPYRNSSLWSEIESGARFGLCEAAARYQPHRGKFTTFAYPTVWGNAKNGIRRAMFNYEKTGTPCEELTFGVGLHDIQAPCPVAGAQANELRDAVHDIVSFLPPTERVVILMTFGLNNYPQLTQPEIAKVLGISRERVRQLIARATQKMRGRYRHLSERAREAL